MSIADKFKTIAENEQKVYDAGKRAEYDRFWDLYQDYGNRERYEHGFGGEGWTKEVFRPKYDIRPTNAYMMFRFSKIEGDLVEILNDLGVVLDFSQALNMQYLFFQTRFTRLGVIDFTSAKGICDGAFTSNTYLKEIDLIRGAEDNKKMGELLSNVPNLEKVAFDDTINLSISFKGSAKLTTASVQSIIDHLKDLTGQTAQTLTFHATVGGNLTQTQKATITAKNWTLVY